MTLIISYGVGPLHQAEAATFLAGTSLSDLSMLGLGGTGFVLGILFRQAIAWWFTRAERIDAARMAQRSQAYGEIWKHTGAFNLFGPQNLTEPKKLEDLTVDLRDWYFEHGQFLTGTAKEHYFLVQETLEFCRLRGITPFRPCAEVLYGANSEPETNDRTLKRLRVLIDDRLDVANDPTIQSAFSILEQRNVRTVEMLNLLRWKKLRYRTRLQVRGDQRLSRLGEIVSDWKRILSDPDRAFGERDKAECAWLMVQQTMSMFRTVLTEELRSRSHWAW